MQAALGRRYYYGWCVVGVTVIAALLIFGIRSAPSVLIKPLEADFAWTRTQIFAASAIGLLYTGIAAPFGGALMDRFGPTRIMLVYLVVVGGSVLGAAIMNHLWQMTLFWGVINGIGTGLASILGATVAIPGALMALCIDRTPLSDTPLATAGASA